MRDSDPVNLEMARCYWRTLLAYLQGEDIDDDEQSRLYEIEAVLEEMCDA